MRQMNYCKQYNVDGTSIEYQNEWEKNEESLHIQTAPQVPGDELKKIVAIMRANKIKHLDIYDL